MMARGFDFTPRRPGMMDAETLRDLYGNRGRWTHYVDLGVVDDEHVITVRLSSAELRDARSAMGLFDERYRAALTPSASKANPFFAFRYGRGKRR